MVNNNDNSLDEFARNMQDLISEKEKEIFSKRVIEEFNHPLNVGRMNNPDGEGKFTGPCGDTMEIYLKVSDGKIIQILFMTDGCGPTIACGSMLTRMVYGKKIDDAVRITQDDLINALDGLPEENQHCAKLTVDTLNLAVKNYKKIMKK